MEPTVTHTPAVRYAVGQCSLGRVLVAASSEGVCAITVGDDPAVLLNDLTHRFPHTALHEADGSVDAILNAVIEHIENPRQSCAVPLDIRTGTAFQQKVWQALREIPAGSTASYASIARAIGRPTATRAVAQACGANPLAVIIPCHRVVRSDGGLSGYRWGIARKQALLERERRA